MLQTFTRKLCPFVTLAIATVGCGKKFGESKSSPAHTTERQEPAHSMVLELDGRKQTSKIYYMPQAGYFELPEKLKVTGNALGKGLDITYNLDPYDRETYQFKCEYAPTSESEMVLTKCYDDQNRVFGNVTGVEFALKEENIIELRFTGASPTDLKVDAYYNVTWP